MLLIMGILGLIGLVSFMEFNTPADSKQLKKKQAIETSIHKLSKANPHRHTTKLTSPLQVNLSSDMGLNPVDPDEIFILTAQVKSTMNLQNVQMKWAIPDGVEILSGSEIYTVAEVNQESPHTSTMTLRALDNLNYKIHFAASAQKGSGTFSDVKQYNTQMQGQIKADIKTLNKKHDQYMKANSKHK